MAPLPILTSSPYDTDKLDGCFEIYKPILHPFVDQEIRLLELGVDKGGSLLLWRDYFPRGTIVGLDCNPVTIADSEKRIRIYRGRQEDTNLLTQIARENAPDGFDIIIDDASHIAELTRTSFWHLFENHLRPGGIYAIEDWGTGYWDNWPDGRSYRSSRLGSSFGRLLKRLNITRSAQIRSHDFGMVGFIKELIDEQGVGDLTRDGPGKPSLRESEFESIHITSYVVIVTKASMSA